MITLKGKNALVTGAGQGIGREIALKLAQAGANVAISDINPETIRVVASEVEALGCKSLAIQADVSNSESVTSMISAQLEAFQTLDILVNNAGITRDGLIIRMKENDWDAVMNVNLKSVFLCCKEAARPMMKARSGKIINIASIVGIIGNVGQVNYSAAKAGMIGLTKTLAREFAGRNITVNAVAPGFIQSAMTDKIPDIERMQLIDRIPMKRMGGAEDVANATLFLASSLSDYVTGHVLTVSGGLVM